MVTFPNGLVEYEIDNVFVGAYNESFVVNPEEVADYQWIAIDDLLEKVTQNPEKYPFWFKEILKSDEFLAYVASNFVLA